MTGSDVEAVTQVVLHERQGRDRGWWEQMRAQYWPDATVHLSWFSGSAEENIRQTEAMNAGGNATSHRLSPVTVHVNADRALAELPLAIEAPMSVHGVDVVLVSYVRLQYRAQRRDGEWRLLHLDTVYERDQLVVTMPGESVQIDPAELTPYRKPFRWLAWTLNARGYSMPPDLLGEDRPEEVAEFYAGERRWLAGG